MQVVWKPCMTNSDSLQASFRCLLGKIKKPLPSEVAQAGEGPHLPYLILEGNPGVCAAATNSVLLSARDGTLAFPLLGEQLSFSFSRYSACTGLWHWRTLMASSTLNHSLFLPGNQYISYYTMIKMWSFSSSSYWFTMWHFYLSLPLQQCSRQCQQHQDIPSIPPLPLKSPYIFQSLEFGFE